MIEAVMLWNEPNNLSHWDFEVDADWSVYGSMVKCAASAVQAERPNIQRVLGGISPIDPAFIVRMSEFGVLDLLDVVAVHGFPLDWNHWAIDQWPEKLDEIRAVTAKPIWVSEVGASSFGAEEVQEFGLKRTAELLLSRLDHVYWYSLFDLPRAWPATTRHRESEGSSYYRHFYMGLFREDGSRKRAMNVFADYTPALGLCQWFHFEDHRLENAVAALRELGVRKLRTGLSWADFERPDSLVWFDHQMSLLSEFELTVTFCFTPEHCGVRPHHTSPPQNPVQFAEFCAKMVRRYAD
ncbi:MAG TPA: beta-xylosidase [Bryobacteraceae bacterium]|jgi:beta-xylosidase|nr:beta-xylosidase [Bryobacteraceae bacterium]